MLSLLLFVGVQSFGAALYQGVNLANQKPCGFQILDEKGSGATYSALVTTTGIGHASDKPPKVWVATVAGRSNVLAGTQGKDQIAIFTREGSQGLAEPVSFNFKWWHHNHYHSVRCEKLKVL